MYVANSSKIKKYQQKLFFPVKRQRLYKSKTSSSLFVITKINQSPDIFVVFLFLKEKTGTFIVL